jgi:hypothetical protein
MVTSPSELALKETEFFRRKTKELGLGVCGVVLNRSLAMEAAMNTPSAGDVEGSLSGPQAALLSRFIGEAGVEMRTAKAHASLGESIADEHDEPVWVFPYLHTQVVDVTNLERLARRAKRVEGGAKE